MVIDAIGCQGYRAFSRPTRVPLRAVTVIFGKNNSGKTTLVRFPLFAMSSMIDANMYSLGVAGLRFGASFADLASVDQPHPRISIELSWSQGHLVAYELQRVVTATGAESVQPRSLVLDRGQPISRDLSPSAPTARDAINQAADPEEAETFAIRRSELDVLLRKTIHISSARPNVESSYIVRNPDGWSVLEVPYILAADDELLTAVDEWFTANFEESRVEVDRAAFAFRLMGNENGVPINLSDAGRGTQAVLPVVTILLATLLGKISCELLIIEEPEVHLHPSAHGALADLILAVAASDRTQVIVETHSENFVLRMRRRLSDGQFGQADLGLYYIDESHLVNEIMLDQFGVALNWPSGVFESDVAEAQAIVEAKLSAMSQEIDS